MPKHISPEMPSHQIKMPMMVEQIMGMTNMPKSQKILTQIILKSLESILDSFPTYYLLIVCCERAMILWNTIDMIHDLTLLRMRVASQLKFCFRFRMPITPTDNPAAYAYALYVIPYSRFWNNRYSRTITRILHRKNIRINKRVLMTSHFRIWKMAMQMFKTFKFYMSKTASNLFIRYSAPSFSFSFGRNQIFMDQFCRILRLQLANAEQRWESISLRLKPQCIDSQWSDNGY